MSNYIRLILAAIVLGAAITLMVFGFWGWGILSVFIAILITVTFFYNEYDYLFGTFSNITIHGTFSGFFGNAGLSGYFENIKGDNSISTIFYGGNYLNATLKNIEFNNLDYFCNSAFNIGLIVDNIKINSISQGFVVVSTGNIVGTFSNIEIGKPHQNNNYFYL